MIKQQNNSREEHRKRKEREGKKGGNGRGDLPKAQNHQPQVPPHQ
jgi:hypothetical protein